MRGYLCLKCFVIAVLVGLFPTIIASNVAAFESSNVVAKRAYRLTPLPNYQPPSEQAATALTDGVTGTGATWVNGQAVGWSWRSPLVSIEFAHTVTIDRIRAYVPVNRLVGILYPSQIFAYGGNGSGDYGYLGSTQLRSQYADPNVDTTISIDISFDPVEVQQIVLIGFARGQYFFISEIESWTAERGVPLSATLGSLDDVFEDAIARRRAAAELMHQPRPFGPSPFLRWFMPMQSREAAQQDFGARCTVERLDPWDDLLALPSNSELIALIGGRDYLIVKVTNQSDNDQALGIIYHGPLTIQSHALAYVQSIELNWVADVVTPFERANIPPRSYILLLLKIEPNRVGRSDLKLAVQCGAAAHQFDIPVVGLTPDKDTPALSGNMWSYLHGAEHSAVKSAISCNSQFLPEYGIDIGDIPPAALRDSEPRMDFLLRQYMQAFRNLRYVTLFMDINKTNWLFMSLPDDLAASRLRSWWNWINTIAIQENFHGELLLYPIDEPRLSDIPILNRFRTLVKASGIGARIYATIDKIAVGALIPFDMIQILDPTSAETSLIRMSNNAQMLSYSTKHGARALPVNSYYRSQAWRAFDLRLSGIGVWALWDSTGNNAPLSGWSPFGRNEHDFATLYQAPDGCGWPSRRLVGWARGIEEERILRQCSRRIGDEPVRKVVRAALAASNSALMASAVTEIGSHCFGR